MAHQYLGRGKNSQQVEVVDFEFVFHRYNRPDTPSDSAANRESPYESMQEFVDTRTVSSGGGIVRSDQRVI